MTTPSQELTFRGGSSEDAAALQRLQSEHETEQGWTVQQWQKELNRSNGSVWLVESVDTNQPVGYLVMWRVADRLEIVDLLVHSRWRRRSVGRALIEMAAAIGRAQQVCRLVLEVRRDNAGARQFYEAVGFEEQGEKPGFYDDGAHALVMARTVETACD